MPDYTPYYKKVEVGQKLTDDSGKIAMGCEGHDSVLERISKKSFQALSVPPGEIKKAGWPEFDIEVDMPVNEKSLFCHPKLFQSSVAMLFTFPDKRKPCRRNKKQNAGKYHLILSL